MLTSIPWTYIICVAVFELGSLLCAVSSSRSMFIISRSIAGIGGAGLATGALSIIPAITPLRKRAMYLAVIQSIYGVALIIGPVLGGSLTQHLSWRWCFY